MWLIISLKKNSLGVPQTSRDSFQLLLKAGLLSENVVSNMKKMIGLRNIAVHDYQELNIAIVKSVVETHLIDFENFSSEIIQIQK